MKALHFQFLHQIRQNPTKTKGVRPKSDSMNVCCFCLNPISCATLQKSNLSIHFHVNFFPFPPPIFCANKQISISMVSLNFNQTHDSPFFGAEPFKAKPPRSVLNLRIHQSVFINMTKMADSAIDFQVETDSLLGLGESGKLIPCSPRVLSIISSVFERSIQKNEKLLKRLKKKDSVTVFHGSRAPTMGIGQYIDRISKYTCCGTPCLVVAYIYIERYLQKMDAYLTSLNIHRLLITSIMVATKLNDAGCHNNNFYAKVGGVSTKEMNRMEMEFLFNLDFRLHVTADVFRTHCLQLQKESLGANQIDRRSGNKPQTKCLPQIAGYTCSAI